MIHLYPNCIPVMGATHIVFYDLEKQQFKRFSKNELFEAEEIKTLRVFDPDKMHKDGVGLLQLHQMIFSTAASSHLPSIQPSSFYKWKHPSMITNAIVELSQQNDLLTRAGFGKLLLFLEKLLCKHVSFRIMDSIDAEHFFLIVKAIQEAAIHSVQFILPYKQEWDTDECGDLIMHNPKIKWVIFESSPFKRNLENKIFFFEHPVKPSIRKDPDQFMVNVFLFSESQLHHNYFNRKLFVGPGGEIKNAPECLEILGNIKEMDCPQQLIDLVKTVAFQKYWFVTKDRCEVCKDCEFRYMCMDNRVPQQRENGYWYHLQQCNYDPYTGSWKDR